MPYCSVSSCRNHSQSRNLKNAGVSYHRYPKDPEMKAEWKQSTGRNNWLPTKYATMCSEHFTKDDFVITNKGVRYLKSTAIPTLKIVNFIPEQHTVGSKETDVYAGITERQDAFNFNECFSPKKDPLDDTENVRIDTLDREKKLEARLRFYQIKMRDQLIKIKLLRSRNARQKKKMNSKDELLKKLQEKFSISNADLKRL